MDSQPFFRAVYKLISSDTQAVIEVLLGARRREESPLVRMSEGETDSLQAIKLTEGQVAALRKALYEAERSLIFGLLCMIDGVSYTSEDIPDLALIDRATGEPINQDFLHDEFYEAYPDA